MVVDFPAGHIWQEASEEAPSKFEYFPMAHDRQEDSAEFPAVLAYLPATQSKHALEPVLTEYVPATQSRQVEFRIAPDVTENFPSGQPAHSAEPIMSLYSPGLHITQVSPFMPVYPCLHWHSLTLPLFEGELENAGQSSQLSGEIWPVAVEYFPDSQEVH